MASNQTTNFQLSQWDANDEVLRADFNADNLKIETALTALKTVTDKAYTTDNKPVVVGIYIGNSPDNMNYGNSYTQKIFLGFQPRAVIVWNPMAYTRNSSEGISPYLGMAAKDNPASWDTLTINSDGFTAGTHMEASVIKPNLNSRGDTYCYLAFR